MRSFVLVIAGCLALVACTKKRVAPPPGTEAKLGGMGASYRVKWGFTSPCDVDPRTLTDDARSASSMLSAFLDQTSTPPQSSWSAEQLALYEAALRELPPLLDANEVVLRNVSRCAFTEADGARAALTQLSPLVPPARKRLEEATDAVPVIKAGLAVAAWKTALPQAINDARDQWCTPKPKPDIFYAYEDEAGVTEWLFCDGARVTAAQSSKPEFKGPSDAAAKKPGKKLDGKKYLEGAATYPSSEVQHAPKLPAAKAAQSDAAGG
jgi:hypothetical protein